MQDALATDREQKLQQILDLQSVIATTETAATELKVSSIQCFLMRPQLASISFASDLCTTHQVHSSAANRST